MKYPTIFQTQKNQQKVRGALVHVLKKVMAKKRTIICFSVIIVYVMIALCAPLIVFHEPTFQSRPNIGNGGVLLPPVWDPEGKPGYWLGTDNLGRDIFSRIIYGTRISLLIGFFPVIIAVGIGVFVGLNAGFYGGWIDELLMRFTDVIYAFPDLLLVLVIVAILRNLDLGTYQIGPYSIGPIELGNVLGGLPLVFIALSCISWVNIARLVRAQVFSLREKEFIEAARALGSSNFRIMMVHILPNSLSLVIVSAMFLVPTFILTEAFFSFIGVGIRPPTV